MVFNLYLKYYNLTYNLYSYLISLIYLNLNNYYFINLNLNYNLIHNNFYFIKNNNNELITKEEKNHNNYKKKELEILLNKNESILNEKYLSNINITDTLINNILLGLSFGGLQFKPNRMQAYYTRNIKDIKYISGLRNLLILINQINSKLTKKRTMNYNIINKDNNIKDNKKIDLIYFYIKKLNLIYLKPLINALFKYNSNNNKWEFCINNPKFIEDNFNLISLGIWLRESSPIITSKYLLKKNNKNKPQYLRLSLHNINYDDLSFFKELLWEKYKINIRLHKTSKTDVYRIYIHRRYLKSIRYDLSYYFSIEFINQIFAFDPRDGKTVIHRYPRYRLKSYK